MEQLKKKSPSPELNLAVKGRIEQAYTMAELTFELVKEYTNMELDFAGQNDLTPAEFKLLCYFRNTESVSIKDLVKEMKLTPGRITHIITSLEEKKLITRNINPADRRGINVFLTGKSLPLIKDLNDKCIDLQQCVLEKYKPDEARNAICLIKDLVKSMKER